MLTHKSIQNQYRLTLITRTDMSPTPEPNLDLEMNVSTSSAKLEQNTNASLTPLASRNSNTYASIGDWHNGNNTLGVSNEIGRHVLVKESARMRACNSFSFCLNSICLGCQQGRTL